MSARVILAVLAVALLGQGAWAQQRATTGSGRDATDIVAGQGIEWQRDKKIYIARGGVVVTRGETVLQADQMTAYYRDGGAGDGKSKVFRIDATGNVTMRTRDSVASGDTGVYDVDNKVVTLKGKNLSYVAPNSKVTARDSLEYWEEKRFAVARGNAVAVNEDNLIRADILVAYFNDKAQPAGAKPGDGKAPDQAPDQRKAKKNEVIRYEADGNVVIESKENVARGAHLVYDTVTKNAILTGNPGVTNTPGGDKGKPPVQTPQSGDGGRVTGSFVPKPDDPDAAQDGAKKDGATDKKKAPAAKDPPAKTQ